MGGRKRLYNAELHSLFHQILLGRSNHGV